MALVPPQFLDCIVAIVLSEQDKPSSYQWQATGFLVGRSTQEIEEDGIPKKLYTVYLVTNKHVLEEFEEKGNESFVVGFNPHSAEKVGVKIYSGLLVQNGERLWTAHNSEDVAVTQTNVVLLKEEGRQFEFFRLDENLLSAAKMKSEGVSEGDFVYVLGYPMGLVDQDWHYPIVRSGSIARIRDVLEGHRSQFLLDLLNFPGSSGSPVVTKPESMTIEGTQPVNKAYVIGIVSGYRRYEEIVESTLTGREVEVIQNSGLAVSVSSECILETIEEDFKKRRET